MAIQYIGGRTPSKAFAVVESEALPGVAIDTTGGSAVTFYETAAAAGTAVPNDYGPATVFSVITKIVELTVSTAPVVVSFSTNGVDFGPDIEFKPGNFTRALLCKAVQFKESTPDAGATIQIVGWR